MITRTVLALGVTAALSTPADAGMLFISRTSEVFAGVDAPSPPVAQSSSYDGLGLFSDAVAVKTAITASQTSSVHGLHVLFAGSAYAGHTPLAGASDTTARSDIVVDFTVAETVPFSLAGHVAVGGEAGAVIVWQLTDAANELVFGGAFGWQVGAYPILEAGELAPGGYRLELSVRSLARFTNAGASDASATFEFRVIPAPAAACMLVALAVLADLRRIRQIPGLHATDRLVG